MLLKRFVLVVLTTILLRIRSRRNMLAWVAGNTWAVKVQMRHNAHVASKFLGARKLTQLTCKLRTWHWSPSAWVLFFQACFLLFRFAGCRHTPQVSWQREHRFLMIPARSIGSLSGFRQDIPAFWTSPSRDNRSCRRGHTGYCLLRFIMNEVMLK